MSRVLELVEKLEQTVDLDERLLTLFLDECDKRYDGNFPRIEKQAFLIGCAFGYGAAKPELKQLCKIVRAYESHLATMQDINAHMGYKFSQPLIAIKQKVEAIAGGNLT